MALKTARTFQVTGLHEKLRRYDLSMYGSVDWSGFAAAMRAGGVAFTSGRPEERCRCLFQDLDV